VNRRAEPAGKGPGSSWHSVKMIPTAANDSSVRGQYAANWLSTNILQQERYTETGLDATEKR